MSLSPAATIVLTCAGMTFAAPPLCDVADDP